MSRTIKDVARLSGVSIATVSRVTSGSNAVSRKTAAKVLEAASQLQYIPNVLAAELARGKEGVPRMRASYQPASNAVNRSRISDSGVNAQTQRRQAGRVRSLENQ